LALIVRGPPEAKIDRKVTTDFAYYELAHGTRLFVHERRREHSNAEHLDCAKGETGPGRDAAHEKCASDHVTATSA
jgi:hypothetical protein